MTGTRLPQYLASAVRALSPAAVLGLTLAAIFGGIGVADAASTAFVLGKSNSEVRTATLTNSRGTPLSLGAPKDTAPFSVSGQKVVRNLDAQFVGGVNAFYAKSTNGGASGEAIASGSVAGSEAIDAGIVAVRILTSKGRKPQVNGIAIPAVPASGGPGR